MGLVIEHFVSQWFIEILFTGLRYRPEPYSTDWT